MFGFSYIDCLYDRNLFWTCEKKKPKFAPVRRIPATKIRAEADTRARSYKITVGVPP